jgi:hypothetical protein
MAKYIFILLCSLFLMPLASAQITPPAGGGTDQNIILWLSPDTAVYRKNGVTETAVGRNVANWADISGNGFVFTGKKGRYPQLKLVNNKKFLDFNPGDFLSNTAIADVINGLEAFSIFIHVRSNVTGTDNGIMYSSDSPNEADEGLCIRYDANGANTGRTNVIKSGFQGNTAPNQIETTANTQTTNDQVITLTWVKGGKVYSYLNGIANDSSQNVFDEALSGVQSIMLGKGAKDGGADEGWDGYIGTVIFYNESYTSDVVEEIAVDLIKINSIQSGNWSDPNTWSCACVPNDSRTVFIENGHSVIMDVSPSVGGLQINNGGDLDMMTNALSLTVGDLNILGTISGASADLNFTSTQTSQEINVPNTSFQTITLENDFGLTITEGTVSINDLLTLNKGTLTTNGKLVFAATTTTGGHLAKVGAGANLSGTVVYQYYKNNTADGWRYWSMPLNGVSVADFQEEIAVTGGFDDPSTGTGINSSRNSIYTYDAVNQAYSNFPIGGLAADAYFTLGTGYSIWVESDLGEPEISEVTGTPHIGNIAYSLEYTDSPTFEYNGWNLIGNPYLSAIDWDAIPLTRKINMTNAIYMTDNTDVAGQINRSYSNGIGVPSGTSNVIAPSQAFWVQTTSTGASIEFQEADKVQAEYSLYKIAPLDGLVRFVVQDAVGFSDEFVVRFNHDASMKFDSEFDALQFYQNGLYASSTGNDGIQMDINNVPFDENNIVKIQIEHLEKGFYSIGVSEYALYEPGYEVLFLDIINNTEVPLNELADYTFEVDGETELMDRFVLITREVKAEEIVSANVALDLMPSIVVYPNPTVDKKVRIAYHNLASDDLSIQLVDVMGELMFEEEFTNISTSGNIELNLENYNEGVYHLVLMQGENVSIERIVIR